MKKPIFLSIALVLWTSLALAQSLPFPSGGNGAAQVTVPGANTQAIFNDGGVLGADAGMSFNKTTDVLTVNGGVVSGNCATNCLTHDTSAVTGSKTATWNNYSGVVKVGDFSVSVYHDATQSISNNTETVVSFNQERFDTNTFHDTSTNNGRLTFLQAGKYVILANVCFDSTNTTGVRTFNIKAGSTGQNYIGNSGLLPAVVGEVCGVVMTMYNAAANDYATVAAFQTSGGAMNVKASGSSTTRNTAEFSAYKID